MHLFTITMTEHKLTHRPAKKEDAPLIAKAVAMAFGEECIKLYCGNNYIDVLENIAMSENCQYSFRNVIIAEIDGIPAGAICGYDGAKMPEIKKNTIELIRKQVDTKVTIEEETKDGEFYIDSLGVLPEFRGQGIGSTLLKAMRDQALEEGHPLVGLLVDYNNPKAEALYKKLGFKRIDTTSLLGHKMWHMQTSEP